MKINHDQVNIHGQQPPEVNEAMYLLGHFLAVLGAPDMTANFTVTHGDDRITYALEMKEVGRTPWLIEHDETEGISDAK